MWTPHGLWGFYKTHTITKLRRAYSIYLFFFVRLTKWFCKCKGKKIHVASGQKRPLRLCFTAVLEGSACSPFVSTAVCQLAAHYTPLDWSMYLKQRHDLFGWTKRSASFVVSLSGGCVPSPPPLPSPRPRKKYCDPPPILRSPHSHPHFDCLTFCLFNYFVLDRLQDCWPVFFFFF